MTKELNLKPVPVEKPKKESGKGKTGGSRGLSLFELTSDSVHFELLDKAFKLAEEGGLDQEAAMEKALAVVETMTKDKALAYCRRILTFKAEAEAIDSEIKRQTKRKKNRTNQIEAMQKRLVMLLPKDFEAKDALVELSFRNYPVLEVVDLNQVPKDYLVEVPAVAASWAVDDNAKLLKAAKNATADYEAKVAELAEQGMNTPENLAEAAKLLIPGVKVAENWKAAIK